MRSSRTRSYTSPPNRMSIAAYSAPALRLRRTYAGPSLFSKPCASGKIPRFVHVSTDEVYGSLEEPLEADENYPLKPSSPYSASKAGSDLLALSYFTTSSARLWSRAPRIITVPISSRKS